MNTEVWDAAKVVLESYESIPVTFDMFVGTWIDTETGGEPYQGGQAIDIRDDGTWSIPAQNDGSINVAWWNNSAKSVRLEREP